MNNMYLQMSVLKCVRVLSRLLQQTSIGQASEQSVNKLAFSANFYDYFTTRCDSLPVGAVECLTPTSFAFTHPPSIQSSAGGATPQQTVLKNIRMNLKPGDKVAIQGGVGTGKSALLLAMIGELVPVVDTVMTTVATSTNDRDVERQFSALQPHHHRRGGFQGRFCSVLWKPHGCVVSRFERTFACTVILNRSGTIQSSRYVNFVRTLRDFHKVITHSWGIVVCSYPEASKLVSRSPELCTVVMTSTCWMASSMHSTKRAEQTFQECCTWTPFSEHMHFRHAPNCLVQ